MGKGRKTQETPESFCWLYAVGCLESRLHQKTLSGEEYRCALNFLQAHETPQPHLIREWFPKPFRTIEESGKLCTIETMQRYWRKTHRSPKEQSPVYIGQVIQLNINTDDIILTYAHVNVLGSEKIITLSNCHQYELKEKVLVFTHGIVIAEPYRS